MLLHAFYEIVIIQDYFLAVLLLHWNSVKNF